MPHQYSQPPYDQMHMASRQPMPSGSNAYGAAPLPTQFNQPMHMPPTQNAPQPKPMMSTANLQNMSIRGYLDATVVPILLEGTLFIFQVLLYY